MFKVNTKRELFYPIKINQLKEDGSGEVNEITVKIKYKLLTRKEMRELVERSQEAIKIAANSDKEINDLLSEDEDDVIDRITDWDGIIDAETNKAMPFSRAALLAVMEDSHQFSSKVIDGLYFASRDLPVKN